MPKPATVRKMPSHEESLDREEYTVLWGWLTPEALQRGYRESGTCRLADISLWYENGIYHVTGTDKKTGKRLFFESFPDITSARKRFARGF